MFDVWPCTWGEFKAYTAVKALRVQGRETLDAYLLAAYDGPIKYECVLARAGVVDPGVAEFESTMKLVWNQALVPLSGGSPLSVPQKPTSVRNNAYSYRLNDMTTWWQAATPVSGESATDTGNHALYSLAHQHVIDSHHGKITLEDQLLSPLGASYRVAVTVNGAARTEVDPHTGTGDYTVDYAAGTLLFSSPNQPGDVVLVTYHWAASSLLVISPRTGTQLIVEHGEAQFTDDIVLTDSLVYQPYGLAAVFAPAAVAAGYLQAGDKVPLSAPFTYKTMFDFYNEANGALPVYPAMGTGWRGCSRPVAVFQWDWVSSVGLRADLGMELRMWLEHDTPLGGTTATATFYGREEPL